MNEKDIEEIEKLCENDGFINHHDVKRLRKRLSEAQDEIASLRSIISKKDEALKHYTRLKSDTWRNAVDEYGEYWAFDWDGDLQDAPWEIAEKALALTPFEPVAKNEDGELKR